MSNTINITPVADEFSDFYSSRSLGQISLETGENIPSGYGGITFLDSDTLLVTGDPFTPEATIYEVDLLRDPITNSITGFAGPATFFAEAPGIGILDSDPEAEVGGLDGGLVVAPNGTLLYSSWPDNSIGQILPGSTAPDEFIDLTALGVDPPSTGGLTIVPEGISGEGRLKITSFDSGNFYDALLVPDDDGTYDITLEGNVDLTPADGTFRGLEGLAYVDESYPNFTADSVLVVEYSTSSITAFEVDELGNPIVETERTFLENFSPSASVYALAVDPVTGDLLFTVDGGDSLNSQIVLLTDEAPPTATPDNDPFDDVTELDISGGEATASGAVSTSNDVYAIDAKAGELLSIDIDVTEILPGIAYTSDDTQLYLYNEAGDVLAFSEDKSDSLASRVLNYLVPENGTYYAAVTTAGNEPILELGEVNKLLGFEETGLANVVYDITASATDVPDTARLFDIALEVQPDNPIGNVLVNEGEILFLDLNGTRNTDTTGVLPIEVNAEEVNSPENTLDNTLSFEDTLSFGLDVFDFILDFDEPFASTDVDDIIDSFETSGITAIVPPDELVQRIVFTEVEIPDGSPLEVIGTDDSETLEGKQGNDLVAGLFGDDTLFGNSGDDVLRGDANSRSPGGSGGDDVISGGAGNDQIGGKAGNDLLSGDEGDDLIWGDAGNDTIMGVTGNDTLTGDDFSGGSGSDLFVFGNGDGTDTITDFDVTEDFIGLVEGELTFADIQIIEIDGNAAIEVIESGETLAVLQGVGSDELTPELFIVTPDVSLV
ncbi:calcium-binding protein [Limnoraphis robusta Tam1]|uniref:Calcium-binding protein n=1 Tax=Limnoraphis robusta CCNP1315 TaxID=3110306 RepID=A0ABU5TSW6_9CYAN|nr:calcium-binding protein [Limnoraphis robusta]MEA5517949.1 calcium-binding protein [Limnoraphis robusta CCNP1315]MEA5539001.1 calcium-binding protein [Limnoraphis robusta Tam1]MEA5543710.1 calcium-binding protein [Limnoraphis robusta CCNP1324]